MDVLSNTLAGWVTLICVVVITVNGCMQNDYNVIAARQVELNVTTHVPVCTLSVRNLVQCVDICSRAGQCTTINYSRAIKECVLFNIADSETSSPSTDWVAMTMSDMLLYNTKYACDTNSCGNGEQCVNSNVAGPVCASLELKPM